jgi:hypothetical protein
MYRKNSCPLRISMYSSLSVGAEELVGVSPTRQSDRGALCVAVLPGAKVESKSNHCVDSDRWLLQ